MGRRTSPLRMQLNTFYSGPQAWFFLAEDRGYLADEGLEVTFVEGDTAANTIPRMAAGGFDVGYGDVNALIEHAGARKPNAPLAVFASYNASPYTIAVPRDRPIRTPAQLEGRTLVAHPNDAAHNLFPEFCFKTGIRESTVAVEISPAPHSEIVPDLLDGRWDGIFGFVNTLVAASMDTGLVARDHLHFIEYHHHLPELYGMALMVTRELAADEPDTVAALVRAFNHGLRDTVADPQAAIDALVRRNPAMNRESNLQRLRGTLALEMSQPEGARLGIGDLIDERFQTGIDLIARVKRLPHRPLAGELFSRAYLPPLADRVVTLARA